MPKKSKQEELDLEAAIEEAAIDENIEGETKAERFKRLANYRLAVAVKRIRMLKPLAGSNYEFTREQADFLVASLMKEIQSVSQEFDKAEEEIPQL